MKNFSFASLLALIVIAAPAWAQISNRPSGGIAAGGTLVNGNTVKADASGRLVDAGRAAATDGAKLDGLPDSALQDVGSAGTTSTTPRGRINFTQGAVTVSDNAGTNSKDITVPAGFVTWSTPAQAAPADDTAYYMGPVATTSNTEALTNKLSVPRALTVKAASVLVHVAGTLATSETFTCSLRLNSASSVTISSAVKADAVTAVFTSGAMSQAIATTDWFNGTCTTPTWATNPTQMMTTFTLYFE